MHAFGGVDLSAVDTTNVYCSGNTGSPHSNGLVRLWGVGLQPLIAITSQSDPHREHITLVTK